MSILTGLVESDSVRWMAPRLFGRMPTARDGYWDQILVPDYEVSNYERTRKELTMKGNMNNTSSPFERVQTSYIC